jgi:hypothetical protein
MVQRTSILLCASMILIGSAASAATRMYSVGTLSIKSFGNDATTGTTYPYTTKIYLGIPLGQLCNTLAGTGPSYPCSGAAPLAHEGAPLFGSDAHGTPVTGVPVPFALAQDRLRQKLGTPADVFTYGPSGTPHPQNGNPGGSFSYYFPYAYSNSYADLRNAAGNFFGGGGGPPAGWSFTKTEGGHNAGSINVTAGSNQFGGTMNLLGFYFTNRWYPPGGSGTTLVISSTWKLQAVGGGKASTVATGFHSSGTNYTFRTFVGAVYTGFVVATAFPWTTGTATVTATRGPFYTAMKRSGYDNRTTSGAGNIQLVSPMLTHWTCPACGTDYETGAIGVMNLTFVPEPSRSLILLAGISMLGLLYRRRAVH